MMRLALLPVVFLFLLPGYTYAQDATVLLYLGHAGVLKDVGPIGSILVIVSPEFESLGLHKSDIQRDVELKLRLAGITIDGVWPSGTLMVNLSGSCSSDDLCTYHLEVDYKESVFIQRGDESIEVMGVSTWDTGILGTGGSNNLISSVRDYVKDEVDKFINAYLTANPKR